MAKTKAKSTLVDNADSLDLLIKRVLEEIPYTRINGHSLLPTNALKWNLNL